MACLLDGAKPVSEPVLELYPWDKTQYNFNRNLNIFIQENAFENIVCLMSSLCLSHNVLK